MNFFQASGSNKPLMCALSAWTLAQILKFFLYSFIEKKVNWRRLWGSGGMPSSHTSFTLSLAISIGLSEGFNTTLFAIAFALMGVVIYDAMGVRYETGKQGAVINQILNELFVEGKPLTDERLKELVGHSPIEVLGGALVGIIIILIFYM